mmetsp:Transcript_42028/g.119313  ORF Transcript_42028/g.119313 Transcript_42028/m.119313 type:complete len:314 (-) Transcript_42028:421-1362(-)
MAVLAVAVQVHVCVGVVMHVAASHSLADLHGLLAQQGRRRHHSPPTHPVDHKNATWWTATAGGGVVDPGGCAFGVHTKIAELGASPAHQQAAWRRGRHRVGQLQGQLRLVLPLRAGRLGHLGRLQLAHRLCVVGHLPGPSEKLLGRWSMGRQDLRLAVRLRRENSRRPVLDGGRLDRRWLVLHGWAGGVAQESAAPVPLVHRFLVHEGGGDGSGLGIVGLVEPAQSQAGRLVALTRRPEGVERDDPGRSGVAVLGGAAAAADAATCLPLRRYPGRRLQVRLDHLVQMGTGERPSGDLGVHDGGNDSPAVEPPT